MKSTVAPRLFPGRIFLLFMLGLWFVPLLASPTAFTAPFRVETETSSLDPTSPSVSFNGLRHYSRVSGLTLVSVTASDDTGVSRVELYLEGQLVSAVDVVPNLPVVVIPFTWNSAGATNGKHMLHVKAFNAAGNSTSKTLVVVSHNFGAPTPTPTPTFTPTPTPTPFPTPTPIPTPTITPSGNRVIIAPTVSHQVFAGWQASGETGISDRIVTGELYRNAVLDASVELGINRVRIGLQSGLAENSTDYYQLFLNANRDYVDNNNPPEYAAIRANRRVPINDNADPNVINPNGFKWAFIDWQMDKVVVPLRQKLAARGESLWFSVSYIHFSQLNQLHVDNPAEYGELILATWNHINNRYGFVPDGLEVFLEPDNGETQVTESEFAAMTIAARNRLVAAGYAKPVIIAPSTVSAPNARPYYLNLKAANPLAASYIDEIGYHRYLQIDDASLAQLRAVALADGKKTTMSEFGGATYLDLHSDLKVGKVSAWEQYALGYPTADNGYQYFYVTGSNPNFTVNIGSRTKFLRQYMKFIRAGAVMKGVTSTNANFDGLPFQNANGTYVVPIKCAAAGSVTVENLPAGTYGIKYTTASEYDVDLPAQTIPAGGLVTFTIPASGVATVYDLNFMSAAGRK
jgi:hypothetical protein